MMGGRTVGQGQIAPYIQRRNTALAFARNAFNNAIANGQMRIEDNLVDVLQTDTWNYIRGLGAEANEEGPIKILVRDVVLGIDDNRVLAAWEEARAMILRGEHILPMAFADPNIVRRNLGLLRGAR